MTFAFVALFFGAEELNLGLSLPLGFQASVIAGDDLVHDAFVMTVHPKGHILVGGRGYLKVLVDADGDGKAESAKSILEKPDLFPMGLWWTEKELLFVSDRGLQSLPMNGLNPTGPPTLIAAIKAKGEHEAHAVKRGPDGWLYVMCGNMAGIDEKWAADVNSPVKKPVAGCLVRISPDGKRRQVVVDGFRNAYDFDWNSAGDPFTYDSDNERCVSLPWYEGCRFYHIVAGANHGWISPQQGEFWRKPPYYFDVAEPLADLGRGSPTGVVCYKHSAFPPKYRDGLFLLDWTFGKIYFASLTPSGASYDAKVEVFAKPVGDEGFAPVSAAVDPIRGDLLVAIGGRGTRGAVYRIKYVETSLPKEGNHLPPRGGGRSDLSDRVGGNDEPDGTRPPPHPVRRNVEPTSPTRGEVISEAVRRRDLESMFLREIPVEVQRRSVYHNQKGHFSDVRRFEDHVMRNLEFRLGPSRPMATLPWKLNSAREQRAYVDVLHLMCSLRFNDQTSAKGTVFEGYSQYVKRNETSKADLHVDGHPFSFIDRKTITFKPESGNPAHREILRELKRCASLSNDLTQHERDDFWIDLRVNDSLETWSARWLDELEAETSVPELVHTLICLARCPLPDGCEPKLAAALLSLDDKLEKAKAATDRNWPLRIGELHQAIAARWPKVDEEMARHPSFGRPAHVLFAMGKSFEKLRPQAAARTLETLKRQPESDWSPEVVKLLRALPHEQVRPTMIDLWERRGLRDELTNFFTDNAVRGDAWRLVESLSSPRIETVDRALKGLEKLTRTTVSFENAGNAVPDLLAAAERSTSIPKTTIPNRAIDVARRIAGLPNADREAVVAWLKANNPSGYAKLNRKGVDWPAFQRRLANTPWNQGDPKRGQAFYEKNGCAVCHAGSGLGPDLKGVAARFSKDDLFRSIVDPNKDVSDRYRTTQVVTKTGAVHVGLVVYESADGLMLQTAPATMVRIPANDIEEQRLQRTSIMPTGLLDRATDRDLADLLTYLKTR